MSPPSVEVASDASLKRGFRVSLFLHALALAVALLTQVVDIGGQKAAEREALRRAQEFRNAIRVDVVDLPSMKPDELSQIDPTLEVSQNPGAAPVPPTIPKPSKDAMVEPAEKLAAKPDPKAKSKEKEEEEDPRKRIKDIRERLRADSRRQELLAKLEGENKNTGRGGRPALAGNQLSQGYSVTGDIAKDGDVYAGKVKAALLKHWSIPVWMSAASLKAQVLMRISPDGRVVSKEFTKKSGNAEFDAFVEKTIDAANPLPPPPEALRRTYLEDGLGYSFP